MTISIAVDAMGGDVGVGVTIPAALAFLDLHPDTRLILVGQPGPIEAELKRHGRADSTRLSIHPATEVVGMDESPQLALKNKKNSSMRVAINPHKTTATAAMVRTSVLAPITRSSSGAYMRLA